MMSDATTRRIADLDPQQKRALLARLLREKARATDPLERPVHRIFEGRVKENPDAPALTFHGQTLTYADLNTRANRLAHHLKALGVGPEVMVGLCVERGIEMVVGLLAILKAGGAYLPLDPGFPPTRVAFMLADAAVPVLVTQATLVGRFETNGAEIVCLDIDAEALELRSAENVKESASADHLAYAIYTSGSTGTPKGVLITHRALTNFLLSMAKEPGLSASDTLLAVTTLSFDIAALELLLPLTVGARVEVVSRDEAMDGSRLIDRLVSSGATVLQATPASWRLLLESGWEGNSALSVFCGGEALNRDLAERLLSKAGAVWNLYGPTETTVWSTLAKVQSGDGTVPVGRPIAHTRAYVLDAHMRPVPVGVAGELYLGGTGLARGYHGRPSLTAERFLPDPFSTDGGARVYRTGDLARYRPDGVIECLGRVDGQVKIRGYRVELGEVESALSAHPAIREAAAAARDEASGEKQLVAYLVPRNHAPIETELRAFLKERLPEYMIPSAFVVLPTMPMTPNGKIDRKALPDPDPAGGEGPVPYVPPRGPIEEGLTAIWSEILGRPKIGVHDDFFDLGGHSLMAAQLLARVRETFGVEPPLNDLFEAPTVAGLGRLVDAALRSGAGLSVPPLVKVNRDGPLPASFAQQRMWFLDQLDPGRSSYNIPVVVRIQGAIDIDALRRAFNELARRQESLRTTFRSIDGLPIQVVADELTIDLPVEDLSDFPEETREIEALKRSRAEAWVPFQLSRGPLVRVRLYLLGVDDHLAVVTTHHAISDGWSLGVVIQETGALYNAFSRGEESPLAEPAVQYADYAAWQRGWLSGDVLETQLEYWRATLKGVPGLELATDRPRPAAASGSGAQRFREFPKALVEQIQTLGRKEGATLFMTLLAGFEALLSRYSGQVDFAVGVPIAGRTVAEIENLIGYFANTLALRADLAGEPGFREMIRRVRKAALGAYARQDLPFDRLVLDLQPDRDPARSPIFQVMFVLQNAPLPALESANLKMTPVDVESVTSKFDLTLSMIETETGYKGSLEYATDLFDASTADRMLAHLETLLTSALAEPDRPVASLPMLSEAEEKLLLGWNSAGADREGLPLDNDDEAALADLENLSDDELDALLGRL